MSSNHEEIFFKEPLEQSIVKADIVAKYFYAWAKNIIKFGKKYDRAVYQDLCAGPGRYRESQTPSTPLRVLERMVAFEDIAYFVEARFNDAHFPFAQDLQMEIADFDKIATLKYMPEVTNIRLADNANLDRFIPRTPTFTFLDPLGHAALVSREFIASLAEPWGCDVVFFFNYRKINRDFSNHLMWPQLQWLFGLDRAVRLRDELGRMAPKEREEAIVSEFKAALEEVGIIHPLMFKVQHRSRKQTSHHLVFISKKPLAHHLMKSVLSKYSERTDENVLTYEFKNRPESDGALQMSLGLEIPQANTFEAGHEIVVHSIGSMDWLKSSIVEQFSGQRLTVKKVYHSHHFGTPYYFPNYQQAINALESEGLVTIDKDRQDRVIGGRLTLGEGRLVTFHKS